MGGLPDNAEEYEPEVYTLNTNFEGKWKKNHHWPGPLGLDRFDQEMRGSVLTNCENKNNGIKK